MLGDKLGEIRGKITGRTRSNRPAGGAMPGIRYLTVALLATAVLLALILVPAALRTSSPARADHIRGTTYSGTNSAGGVVDFSISADRDEVLNFRYTEPTIDCPVGGETHHAGIPILDHEFFFPVGPASGIAGIFPSAGTAAGTIDPLFPGKQPCDQLTWTATADG